MKINKTDVPLLYSNRIHAQYLITQPVENIIPTHHLHLKLCSYQLSLLNDQLCLCVESRRCSITLHCDTVCCFKSIPSCPLITQTSNATLIMILICSSDSYDLPETPHHPSCVQLPSAGLERIPLQHPVNWDSTQSGLKLQQSNYLLHLLCFCLFECFLLYCILPCSFCAGVF